MRNRDQFKKNASKALWAAGPGALGLFLAGYGDQSSNPVLLTIGLILFGAALIWLARFAYKAFVVHLFDDH